jgi:hypothetical protein
MAVMLLWFLIIISVNSNGTVNAALEYPTSYRFNSESHCETNGRKKVNELQMELGTKNSKLFYICKPLDVKEVAKMLPPS